MIDRKTAAIAVAAAFFAYAAHGGESGGAPQQANSTVYGHAEVMGGGGTLVTCAGRLVSLEPSGGSGRQTARCDAGGHFAFGNVPRGRAIVRVSITWQAPAKHGMRTFGKDLEQAVDVHPGRNLLVLDGLSRSVPVPRYATGQDRQTEAGKD